MSSTALVHRSKKTYRVPGKRVVRLCVDGDDARAEFVEALGLRFGSAAQKCRPGPGREERPDGGAHLQPGGRDDANLKPVFSWTWMDSVVVS